MADETKREDSLVLDPAINSNFPIRLRHEYEHLPKIEKSRASHAPTKRKRKDTYYNVQVTDEINAIKELIHSAFVASPAKGKKTAKDVTSQVLHNLLPHVP